MSSFTETKVITEEILVAASFDGVKLKEQGFSAKELKVVGFDAFELKTVGFTPIELRVAGFTPEELREAGFNVIQVHEAGFSHRRLMQAGFGAFVMQENLKLTLPQLKAAGFSVPHFKSLGFTAAELRGIGLKAVEVTEYYSPGELLRAGYTKEEMKPLGAWPHDGNFKTYNQYWDCCFGLDRNSKYCVPHQ